MPAAIVLRHDFNILVPVASLHLVLDADVGEVDALVEVREVMLAGPVFDLARITIRPAVAVRPAAIRLLEPLLVLPLELGLEDDALNLGALGVQALVFAPVRLIDLDVVRQLARATDARVEALRVLLVRVAPVRIQQMSAAVGERHRAVASVELDGLQEVFAAEVPQVRLAPAWRVVAGIAQITFRHDPKRADGRERTAVVAVQFVAVFGIEHDLAFEATRQIEIVDERIARIAAALARLAVPCVIVAIARVVRVALGISKLDPRHLDVADIAVAIARIKVHSRIIGSNSTARNSRLG